MGHFDSDIFGPRGYFHFKDIVTLFMKANV